MPKSLLSLLINFIHLNKKVLMQQTIICYLFFIYFNWVCVYEINTFYLDSWNWLKSQI